jgi:two-component system nitrate/nitrite response regulator NarL
MLDESNDHLIRQTGSQKLTAREIEVVGLVARGFANKVVARELGVAEGTVKIHLHRIYRKLRVANRAQLTLRVVANGRKLPKSKDVRYMSSPAS